MAAQDNPVSTASHTAAVADAPARLEPEIAVNATVLAVRRGELRQLGILSATPGANPWGSSFAAMTTGEKAQSLTSLGSEVLHTLRFRAFGGKVTQVRIGSSTPVAADTLQGSTEYLDAAIEIEFAHRAMMNQDGVPLTLAARLQVRSGNSAGGLARTVFTTHPIQYEARVPDGSTIVLGGFVSDLDARLLTGMKGANASTLLRHLFSEEERSRETEIVVLLSLPDRGGNTGNSRVASTESNVVPRLGPSAAPEEIPVTQQVPQTPPIETIQSPPSPPPDPQPSDARFTVQVGAFGSLAAAQTLMRDLSAHYPNVSLQAVEGDKPLYRVRIGGFATRSDARETVDRLRGSGFEPFIAPLN